MTIKKRFWTDVAVKPADGRFEVTLDGKTIKTPAKAALLLPSQAIADCVAREWDAQDGDINPDLMPATRMANSVIDKVTLNRAAIIEMLAEYGGSDLLCYRATGPEELIARQADAWDPILDWVDTRFGRLNITEGVMHIDQPQTSLAALKEALEKLTNWELAAAHDLITISGSLVLAMTVMHDHLLPSDAWALSRIDETWQIEQWGADEEAETMAARKWSDFEFAAEFFNLARNSKN